MFNHMKCSNQIETVHTNRLHIWGDHYLVLPVLSHTPLQLNALSIRRERFRINQELT
jgi:hypothetical protein